MKHTTSYLGQQVTKLVWRLCK